MRGHWVEQEAKSRVSSASSLILARPGRSFAGALERLHPLLCCFVARSRFATIAPCPDAVAACCLFGIDLDRDLFIRSDQSSAIAHVNPVRLFCACSWLLLALNDKLILSVCASPGSAGGIFSALFVLLRGAPPVEFCSVQTCCLVLVFSAEVLLARLVSLFRSIFDPE